MKFHNSLFYQLILVFLFSIIFFGGSLFLDEYTFAINQEKSLFPILIYTNTLTEANDILDFVNEHRVYLRFNMTNPSSIEDMLIEKYGFTDFRDMARDFTLPFLLELYIYPFPSTELIDFINEITTVFPNHVVHFNENSWLEIDGRIARLNKVIWVTQILLLITYLFSQLVTRLYIVIKNRENINAIMISGISPAKLSMRRIKDNLWFLFISLILVIVVNYFVNYVLVFEEFALSIEYFDPVYIAMLFATNILIVMLQRPVYPKKRYE